MNNLDSKLDFYIKHNLNVMFIGKHGVGKTSIVKSAFERNNLNWRYFSASTMDPWVDFVGVPKEKIIDGVSYLELIRPKEFAEDEVEAIFVDEYNRGHKKIRNAIMELIQFGSVNGRKFNKLKIVWAAINPSDDDLKYDVEDVDPAQEDRFHVKIEIPYEPNLDYFIKKYGEKIAKASVSWWNDLSKETKELISPRRLDYALNLYKLGGDIRDILPNRSGITKLSRMIRDGPVEDQLDAMISGGDIDYARKWISNENNYEMSINSILSRIHYIEFFIPLMNKEKIVSLISENKNVREFVFAKSSHDPDMKFILQSLKNINSFM